MAYSISWDEGVPVGATTPAADIDTEIQKVKTSLRERLEQVLPDFDSDVLDPKLLVIISDLAANKPAAPDYHGQLFFSEDTGTLYIGDVSLEWVAVSSIVEEGETEIGTSTLSVMAHLTAASTAIPGDTNWHKLSGWTVDAQRGTFYEGANPTRFTSPALGDYKISGSFTVAPSSNPTNIMIGINGGNPTGTGRTLANGATQHSFPFETIVSSMAAGSYIEFWASTDLVAASAFFYSYSTITMHRLP